MAGQTINSTLEPTHDQQARVPPRLPHSHPDSLCVGRVSLGALIVADDLVLSSGSSKDVHSLVMEAKLNNSCEQYSFSKIKTKAMAILPKIKKPQSPYDTETPTSIDGGLTS